MFACMPFVAVVLLAAPAHAVDVTFDSFTFHEPLEDLDVLFPPDGVERLAAWKTALEADLEADPGFPADDTVVFDLVLSASAPAQLTVHGDKTFRGRPWSWAPPAPLPEVRLLAAELGVSIVVRGPQGPAASLKPHLWLDRIPADATPGQLNAAITARARTYVLPLEALIASTADPKFAGVRRVGALLTQMNAAGAYDPAQLYSDAGYWRGVLEMHVGNPLVQAGPVVAGIAAGRLEASWRLLSVLANTGDAKNIVRVHLSELAAAYDRLEEQRAATMQRGIALEDKGLHEEAISVYEQVLADTPCSAWALYERGFSLRSLGSLEAKEQVDAVHRSIFACDPLYPLALSATGPEEVAQVTWRLSMRGLFQDSTSLASDLVTYANAALELGEAGEAGQAYWLAAQTNASTPPMDQLLGNMLLAAISAGAPGIDGLIDGDGSLLADARARQAQRSVAPAQPDSTKRRKRR